MIEYEDFILKSFGVKEHLFINAEIVFKSH